MELDGEHPLALHRYIHAVEASPNPGRADAAEVVFREDLERLPENGWSLYGLARSLDLQRRKRDAAQVRSRFERVWAGSDVDLTTPCYCEPSV